MNSGVGCPVASPPTFCGFGGGFITAGGCMPGVALAGISASCLGAAAAAASRRGGLEREAGGPMNKEVLRWVWCGVAPQAVPAGGRAEGGSQFAPSSSENLHTRHTLKK